MNYRPLGNSGLDASVVGLGGWAIGGGAVWGGETDDQDSIDTVRAAVDAGVNLIDTAPSYGFGRSEEVIGRAVKGIRDKVLLATKCGMWWEDGRGSYSHYFDGKEMRISLRPDTIREELDNSLRRLNVEHIDLYQTHRPAIDPDKTPIAETIGCLMDLKAEGKIRAIGVSNVSPEELRENIAAGEIAANQPRYSMLWRDIEKDVLPICRDHNIAVLAYSPLEQGLLTGKVGMDRQYKPDDFRNNPAYNPWFLPENRRRVLEMLEGWSELTRKYDCSLAQLVVAWTISQPGITHALCGARRVRQIEDTVRAGSIDIEMQDLRTMRDDITRLGMPI